MYNFRIKSFKKLVCYLGLVGAFFLSGCASQQTGSKFGVADKESFKLSEIKAITLNDTEDSIDVVISGAEPLTYTSVKQPDPLGVILYFPNTSLNGPENEVRSSGAPVTSIKGFVETLLFPNAYRRFGHLTVAHPILAATGIVEPFANGNGFTLRVQHITTPAVIRYPALQNPT